MCELIMLLTIQCKSGYVTAKHSPPRLGWLPVCLTALHQPLWSLPLKRPEKAREQENVDFEHSKSQQLVGYETYIHSAARPGLKQAGTNELV
jgi:hypothetical protein